MNIRVRRAAIALLALTLSLDATSAFAAARDRDVTPRFVEQIVRRVKKILKPFIIVSTDENQGDGTPYPGPPKP